VYGHDGKVYNVTMEPGDMVLYESHSVLHGRPFPLKGRYYANIFVHFEPAADLSANEAAKIGDLIGLQEVAEDNRSQLYRVDENQWQPIHEAARGAHIHVIEYLVQQEVDINALTLGSETPLDIAILFNGEDHPVVKKLRDLGALPFSDLEETEEAEGEKYDDDEEDSSESHDEL